MILRSPFIRLKTNSTASQPTRTRAPVNSFLSSLDREGSCALHLSIYRQPLLPTHPDSSRYHFPSGDSRLPAALVERWARDRKLHTGQRIQPCCRPHHTWSHRETYPAPSWSSQGFLLSGALCLPKMLAEQRQWSHTKHIRGQEVQEHSGRGEGFLGGTAYSSWSSLAVFLIAPFLNRKLKFFLTKSGSRGQEH